MKKVRYAKTLWIVKHEDYGDGKCMLKRITDESQVIAPINAIELAEE